MHDSADTGVIAIGGGDRAPATVTQLHASGPEAKTFGARSLPAPLSSFVGRGPERSQVAQLLAGSRLVSVIGPGGVGKTRLALAVAEDHSAQFEGRVSFAALAAVADPLLAVSVVGAAVGLDDRTGISAETVAEFLSTGPMLLVVDNCEHLLPAVGRLLLTLLSACPQLHVLATSRAPLGVAGESVIALAPLAVPGRPGPSPAGLAELVECESVRLFGERAAAAAPGFTVTAENAAAVALLCRRLDGLPLAVELAAGRVRAFAVGDLANEVERRLEVLDLPAGVEGRTRSVVASLDWSYELLSDGARALWLRLGVLAGGATIETARVACADLPEVVAATPELLAELVDHSILTRQDEAGSSRYRMLEVVRAYASERLEAAGERDGVVDRLGEHILGWAERAAWFGSDQLDVLARLEGEQANIIAVLEDAVARPAAAPRGLALAGHLVRWWTSRGHLSEGRHFLHSLLDRVPEPSWDRFNSLGIAGVLAAYAGELGRAEQFLQEQLRVGTQAGVLLSSTESFLATLRLAHGDVAGANAYMSAAMARPGFPEDDWEYVHCTELRARVAIASGEITLAGTLMRAALTCCEDAGELWYRQRLMEGLGQCALAEGRLAEAAERFEQAFDLGGTLGDWRGRATAAEGLVEVALARDAPDTAARVLGAAAALWQLPGLLPAWWSVRHERSAARAQAALGDRRFGQLQTEGSQLTVTEAWQSDPVAIVHAQAGMLGVRPARNSDDLSQRELQVLSLLSAPATLRDIAAELCVSPNTLKSHCKSLYRKLGVSSRTDAVDRGRQTGLIR